jgi:hypothetical protein
MCTVVHLETLLVSHTTQRRSDWMMLHNELERMWMEVVYFKLISHNLLRRTEGKCKKPARRVGVRETQCHVAADLLQAINWRNLTTSEGARCNCQNGDHIRVREMFRTSCDAVTRIK